MKKYISMLDDEEFEGVLDPEKSQFVIAAKQRLADELDKLPKIADEVNQMHLAGNCAEAAEKLLSYARGVKFQLKNYEGYYKALE